MLFLIIVGLVSLVFGILMLVSPGTIRKLDEASNRALASMDQKIYELRVGVGVSSILVSVLAFFVAYFIVRRLS